MINCTKFLGVNLTAHLSIITLNLWLGCQTYILAYKAGVSLSINNIYSVKLDFGTELSLLPWIQIGPVGRCKIVDFPRVGGLHH